MSALFGGGKSAASMVQQVTPKVEDEPTQPEDKRKAVLRNLLIGTSTQGVLEKATTARGKILGN